MIHFFGQYLLQREVVTSADLERATQLQGQHNRKIGAYAVEEGYLTEGEVMAVHSLQRTKDLRFGEAAVLLNLLNDSQVERLLALQKSKHMFIGQAVVQLGIAREEVVDRCLEDFQDCRLEEDSEDLSLPSGVSLPEVFRTFLTGTRKMLLRMGGVKTQLGQNQDALHDMDGVTVEIPLSGDASGSYAVALPRHIAICIGREFMGEDLNSNEDLEDMIREFANVVAGYAIARLAEQGIQVSMSTPRTLPRGEALGRMRQGQALIETPVGMIAALVLT